MKTLRLAASLWMAGAVGGNLFGQAGVLTWHNDNFRTGQNLQETALTPANVNASTFGKLFTIGVDGRVDAEPLYVPSLAIPNQGLHNVLFVVTEHDSVYAFDADTGAQLWHVSMLLTGEVPSDDRGCGQVTPEIGVTSTPAIDLQVGPHGTMYVVAMSKNGSTWHQRLHALDLTTGGEQFSGPIEVQATYAGTGDGSVAGLLTFDPKQYKERAGLLISNGVLYTSWASHCDIFPYTAWVIGYNELTLSRVSILNLTPNGSDGSVWAAGAGPAADANGNIFLLMANGTFEPTLDGNGFPNKQDYGNAFVKIATGGTSVGDYFNMFNTVSESNADADLGSGGAMLLPPLNNAQGQSRDLAVGAGKDHHIYVVDRAAMGKFNMTSNAIYQDLPSSLANSVFSSPAWFNGMLYYGAVGDRLKGFAFASGLFGSSPSSQTANAFGYPGTTPSISANGTANGIVWAAENVNPAVLHAYDATNLATELYNTNMAANNRDHFGAGNKFIVPMVVNGKVYVGTTNGVGVFGFLCGTASVPIPANNATGVGLSPTLSWTAATGAVSYDVALSTTNPPSVVATGLTGTTYPVTTPLASATKYYWYVTTHNCTGSAQSPTWSFTTLNTQLAAITNPANGSTFAGSSVNFQWSPGTGVTQYWLSISKVGVGGGDLFNADPGPGLVTSRTISGLPTDGSTIYVRLYSHIGSTWPSLDYTYTASGGATAPAAIISPTNGSTLPGSSATFQWTSGTGVNQYWLSVSKVGVGGGDLFNADPGPGLVTSKTITGLPTDGSTIYVRLYSHIGSNWPSFDYTYTAAGAVSAPATITSPANGSTLAGASVNFQWTTGTGVSQYWLSISKVGVGGGELYNADPGPGLVTSKTITGLPTDGSTIYVRLYSHIGSTWPSLDYTYTASGGTSTPATITSPANGSTLAGSSVTFQWTTGTGVTQYWLSISKVGVGGGDLYNADPGPGLVTSKTITGLPTDGSTIYVRLYSHIGTTWPSHDYTYTAFH